MGSETSTPTIPIHDTSNGFQLIDEQSACEDDVRYEAATLVRDVGGIHARLVDLCLRLTFRGLTGRLLRRERAIESVK
jgi:hypothetical protein